MYKRLTRYAGDRTHDSTLGDPNEKGFYSEVGQRFKGGGEKLMEVDFYVKRNGTGGGNLRSRVYEANEEGEPTGAVLGTSQNTSPYAATTNAYRWIRFTFLSANQVELEEGKDYVITIEAPNASGGSNYMLVARNYTAGSTGGGAVYLTGGDWYTSETTNYLFYVFDEEEEVQKTDWLTPEAVAGSWTNMNNALSQDGTFATYTADDVWGFVKYAWGTDTSGINGHWLAYNSIKTSSSVTEKDGAAAYDWEPTPRYTYKSLIPGANWWQDLSFEFEMEADDDWPIVTFRDWNVPEELVYSTIPGIGYRYWLHRSGTTYYIDHAQLRIHYTSPFTTAWKSPASHSGSFPLQFPQRAYADDGQYAYALFEEDMPGAYIGIGFDGDGAIADIVLNDLPFGGHGDEEYDIRGGQEDLWGREEITTTNLSTFHVRVETTAGYGNNYSGFDFGVPSGSKILGIETRVLGVIGSMDVSFYHIEARVIYEKGEELEGTADETARTMWLSGGQADDSARVMWLSGGKAEDTSRKMYLFGAEVETTNRTMWLAAHDKGEEVRKLWLSGGLLEDDSRKIWLQARGQGEDTRKIWLVGYAEREAVRRLWLSGGREDESVRKTWLSGGLEAGDVRKLYTHGGRADDSARTMYLSGGLEEEVSRKIWLDAKNTGEGTRVMWLSGGKEDDTSRLMWLSGGIETDTVRKLYTSGHKEGDDIRTLYVHGGLETDTSRSIWLSGGALEETTRKLYTHGSDTGESTRKMWLQSIYGATTSRKMWLHGKAQGSPVMKYWDGNQWIEI